MTDILALVLLALAVFPLLLGLMNLAILRATPRYRPHGDVLVSILIPARNEAAHIGPALVAARASMGVPVEILVMDDGSTDETAAIVQAHAARDGRVRLLTAPALEDGWTGKVHACHHLAEAASGTHLLFVDADVRLEPQAAAALAGHAQASGAGLVSAVPRQITRSLGELLTVPTINILLLGYLPMGFMRLSRDPGLGAACGQLVLAEREAYREVGGHGAIRGLLHDGIQLARVFRRRGHMTDLVLGDTLASCRMYRGFGEAWAGFAKNAHEGMATPVGLPVWTILLLGGHVLPFCLLPFAFGPVLALAALASLSARAIVTLATRENLLSIPLHPFTMLVGLAIQWSVLLRIGGARRAGWKGRLYPAG
ncbi:glycosyltransferase [Microvirga pudoricolor]|uniref:glycosyltransferase n=1 Tax=Microvirga pudoricolor TaxID=2778729 RepID=UPI0019505FF6|nr:glycosyltransferase family A protein [Microvirga pudoricolor]MBM6593475.1 glycosyltransferase [Microvirga pudoricolor]